MHSSRMRTVDCNGRLMEGAGVPPWGVSAEPPPHDGHCSGRNASYWNAFLLLKWWLLESNPPPPMWTEFLSHACELLLRNGKNHSNTACKYRSGTVNSNTVNSKFHLIQSYYEIFFYHFSNISCLKCTVNSNFHLIRSKTLPTNDFELTVPNL